MPKRKIHSDGHGSATYNEALSKPKKKPTVPYIYPVWMLNYWKDRDRVIYRTSDEETRKAILERYGKVIN